MKDHESRFAACHPAATFTFFMVAIAGSVLFQHPAYLLVSILSAFAHLLSERGRKGVPMVVGMIPLFFLLSALNPLFNTYGAHVLFQVFGRNYTLEALLYGMAISGMLVSALVWFSCYSAVMTSDKFTCLFGNLIPAISLILVMVLRLIPSYQRKARQIAGARRCMGKSAGSTDNWKEKAEDGMTILSSLTSWALEGAVITADSMRARGYGVSRRSSFQIYVWRLADVLLLLAISCLLLVTALGAARGWTKATFTPALEIAPIFGVNFLGIAAYGTLLLIPSIMNTLEALKWKFFQSKI